MVEGYRMPYKTLLLHVDSGPHSRPRTVLAANLANAHTAHLTGSALTGVSRHVHGPGGLGQHDPVVMRRQDQLRSLARDALTNFENVVHAAGVQTFTSRIIDDEVAAGMALQARYADLVIVSQFDPGTTTPGQLADFPETVILDSPCPVLVIPYAGAANGLFRSPMLAWDGSLHASRAIRGALPLLALAGRAEILICNPDDVPNGHGEEPGADLALWLARHGIAANVSERHVAGSVGEALLSIVSDLNADLLVMGAYGHSRFREAMLGGTSRTILQSMTVPVLMAH